MKKYTTIVFDSEKEFLNWAEQQRSVILKLCADGLPTATINNSTDVIKFDGIGTKELVEEAFIRLGIEAEWK